MFHMLVGEVLDLPRRQVELVGGEGQAEGVDDAPANERGQGDEKGHDEKRDGSGRASKCAEAARRHRWLSQVAHTIRG